MPRFTGQNKKKTNPRYFLNESLEREDIIEDIREFSKDVTGSRNTYGDMEKLAVMDMQELEQYFKSLINQGPSATNRETNSIVSSIMQDDPER